MYCIFPNDVIFKYLETDNKLKSDKFSGNSARALMKFTNDLRGVLNGTINKRDAGQFAYEYMPTEAYIINEKIKRE